MYVELLEQLAAREAAKRAARLPPGLPVGPFGGPGGTPTPSPRHGVAPGERTPSRFRSSELRRLRFTAADGRLLRARVCGWRWQRSRLARMLGAVFERPKGGGVRRVSITVNGAEHELELEPRELLVYVLRERLGLTGTNVGCDTSSCGACTVLLDGESVKSCTLLGVQADGREITTIEGLATNGSLAPGAGGVPRAARPPVRLLHAGVRHGDGQPARARTRTRPRRRSGTRSRATSAAAPATTTSSARSQAAAGVWRSDDGDYDRDSRSAGSSARRSPARRTRRSSPGRPSTWTT